MNVAYKKLLPHWDLHFSYGLQLQNLWSFCWIFYNYNNPHRYNRLIWILITLANFNGSFLEHNLPQNSNAFVLKLNNNILQQYHNIIKKIKKAHKYYCLFSTLIHTKHFMLILYFEHNRFFYNTTVLTWFLSWLF